MSGPSSFSSWRSSTISVSSPTSRPCRRAGVLRASFSRSQTQTWCRVRPTYTVSTCVFRKPVEGEERHRERFAGRSGRHRSETHRGSEPDLQDTPPVHRHCSHTHRNQKSFFKCRPETQNCPHVLVSLWMLLMMSCTGVVWFFLNLKSLQQQQLCCASLFRVMAICMQTGWGVAV